MTGEGNKKLLILSNPANPHTIKWVKALDERGFKIFVFGLSNYDKKIYESCKNVLVYSYSFDDNLFTKSDGALSKIVYLRALNKLKQVIREFKPDILHSHYATSYGLLGALTGFHPYIISVWGSDVYDFPKKSWLHRFILKNTLKKTDKILSTSRTMAEETKLYTNKGIEITPFGIDTEIFKPMRSESLFENGEIIIGTVKTLEVKYGVDNLIKAFGIIKDKCPELPLRLLIVGCGTQETSLKKMVEESGLKELTTFTGYILPEEVPRYQNMLTISVSLSLNESFGVAVLEALACEKPVVVTNVDGFREIVEDGVTGILVPVGDINKTVEAIENLIEDKEFRIKLGKAGRERVIKCYDWKSNVEQMINIYTNLSHPNS